jgi:hypothetical protein
VIEAKPKKRRVKATGPFRQGMFTPKNAYKYLGDVENITFRSSWEKKVFEFLDTNDYIIGWASEPFPIEYMKPVMVGNVWRQKKAKYFPDIYVEYIDKDGHERRELIEIKPDKQTRPSKAKKPTVRMQENYAYSVNMAKWEAAEKFCKSVGIVFKVATEKELFR